jgi:hypothetical protein
MDQICKCIYYEKIFYIVKGLSKQIDSMEAGILHPLSATIFCFRSTCFSYCMPYFRKAQLTVKPIDWKRNTLLVNNKKLNVAVLNQYFCAYYFIIFGIMCAWNMFVYWEIKLSFKFWICYYEWSSSKCLFSRFQIKNFCY